MSRAQGDALVSFVDAFEGRRVLLTGHTGFKGSWLTLWLHQLGAIVTGFALSPPTHPNNFDESRVGELLSGEYRADIRDRDAVVKALEASDPEVVLHLAARTVVRESYADPLDTISANVVGTAAVLDAIRIRAKRCAVVVVSSDKCYANDESGRLFVEEDRLGGDDPYSASKGAVEVITHSYLRSFFPPEELDRHGVALASARAGNVIGGGDWTPDGLVADVMRALRDGNRVVVRRPTAVRPWQHVLEPLSGYLTLAARLLGPGAGAFCGAWNFGPEESSCETVAQVVDRLVTRWGDGEWEARTDPSDPHEANILRLSSAKARQHLGWRSRWTTEQAIDRTVAWYRRYETDRRAAREACLTDLAGYTNAQ